MRWTHFPSMRLAEVQKFGNNELLKHWENKHLHISLVGSVLSPVKNINTPILWSSQYILLEIYPTNEFTQVYEVTHCSLKAKDRKQFKCPLTEKCTSTQGMTILPLKRMRKLFMYLLYLIKSKMPLIISYIWLPELLKCVWGGGGWGERTFRINEIW